MHAQMVRCCAVVAAALVGAEFSWTECRVWGAVDETPGASGGMAAQGRELFERVWQPQDPRSSDGDGLGPVFNDVSCVACHSQGGVGGAGSAEKNVQIVLLRREHDSVKGQQIHPGLSAEGSATVLHRRGVAAGYAPWREARLGLADGQIEPHLLVALSAGSRPNGDPGRRFDEFERGKVAQALEVQRQRSLRLDDLSFSRPPLFLTERNAPALFGAGLIDLIGDGAISAAASRQRQNKPTIAGRPGQTPGGRIGRFGWQAQQASLSEFVLTACAVELGLNVPGHQQAGDPQRPDQPPPGSDLDVEQCAALIAFVAALPRPHQQIPPADRALIAEGHRTFAKIGCVDCHLYELGGVKGIYSDLLLHEMGYQLAGSSRNGGGYGAFVAPIAQGEPGSPTSPATSKLAALRNERSQRQTGGWGKEFRNGPGPFECRTPPLWGVAASAPYLHDGRAATLRDAILMHAGQGAAAKDEFQKLDERQKQLVLIFLNSLKAPEVRAIGTEVPPASQREAREAPKVRRL